MKRKRMGAICGLIFVVFTMSWQGMPKVCLAYIPPSKQLIQLMARNFQSLETVHIVQDVYEGSQGNNAAPYHEKIWVKSPHFYHAEGTAPNTNPGTGRDHRFRHFLIANTEQRLILLLDQMGVNLKEVAYTRIDGVIAYRIGSKEASQPKIIIEKERFLPLLLVHHASSISPERTVSIRFNDYKKVEQGWYPFEITVAADDVPMTRFIVQQLKVNIPLPASIFRTRDQTPSEKKPDSAEDDRLRKIIDAFDEKYR